MLARHDHPMQNKPMGLARMTVPRLLLLRALLDDPARERYGLDLALEAGLEPGSVYPILVAFENAGWMRSRLEDVDASEVGRPRRRYYRLTADGIEAGRAALERKRRPRAVGGELAW
jgi:PadR family transcriptional regulator